MAEAVWYILAEKGSELSEEDPAKVMCKHDDTIADLKIKVHESNTNTLTGVDSRKLEVFEFSETGIGARRQGPTMLSECISGRGGKPFRIFYPGIPVEPRTSFMSLCMLHPFVAFVVSKKNIHENCMGCTFTERVRHGILWLKHQVPALMS
jgi:hypothetical protein